MISIKNSGFSTKNRYTKSIGFTLAEVLITLMIIGVVASLTIPVVTRKIQDAQHKAAWKKTYSSLSQATDQLMTDTGRDDIVSLFSGSNDMRNKYANYFKTIKSCDFGVALGNCWHKNDGSAKYLDGSNITAFGDEATFILSDGSIIRFDYDDDDCLSTQGSLKVCGRFIVDTNGFKSPNMLGKDIHNAWILNDRVLPQGTQGDGSEDTCNSSSTGFGCSSELLYK